MTRVGSQRHRKKKKPYETSQTFPKGLEDTRNNATSYECCARL